MTSHQCHFGKPSGLLIGMSLRWSNRVFGVLHGVVGGGRPRGVLDTNICPLVYVWSLRFYSLNSCLIHYVSLQSLRPSLMVALEPSNDFFCFLLNYGPSWITSSIHYFLQNFYICFGVSFNHFYQKLIFG